MSQFLRYFGGSRSTLPKTRGKPEVQLLDQTRSVSCLTSPCFENAAKLRLWAADFRRDLRGVFLRTSCRAAGLLLLHSPNPKDFIPNDPWQGQENGLHEFTAKSPCCSPRSCLGTMYVASPRPVVPPGLSSAVWTCLDQWLVPIVQVGEEAIELHVRSVCVSYGWSHPRGKSLSGKPTNSTTSA